MLTSRGGGLLGGAIALWVASRALGAAELQIAAVALLGLLVLAFLHVALSSSELLVDRVVQPARLPFGGDGRVSLVLHNRGFRRTARIRAQDQAPAALASPPRRSLPPMVRGERIDLSYPISAGQRGVSTLGPVTIELSDPFGLWIRTKILPDTSTVTVRPRVVELPRGLPLGGSSGGSGEGRPRPQPGGEDLAEVREYVSGDPLRSVHWPSTAHRGKLMVRREESPQDPRATVLLDLRASRHRGSGPTSSLETAVSAAASVTVQLAARGQAVAIVDQPSLGGIPVRSADAWLDHLAEVQASQVSMQQMLAPLTMGGTVGSALIAVVTTPDRHDLQWLVRTGRGSSTRVGVIIDTAGHAPGSSDGTEAAVAARRLQAAGWRVTTITAGDDLAAKWAEILHVRRPSGVGA